MKDETIKVGEERMRADKQKYKILSFDSSFFINHDPTWLVEYTEDQRKMLRQQSRILKDKVTKLARQ